SLMDKGHLTPEQATEHPWRHALSRSLGAGEQTFEGEFQRLELADGDQLLLCTDGLTMHVDDNSLTAVLARAATAAEASSALVQEALAKGGRDNVTVALARYKFSP